MNREFINSDPNDEVLDSAESAFPLRALEQHYNSTHRLDVNIGSIATKAVQVETGMDG